MENIKIDLGFAVLVAEQGTDKDYNEIFVWLEDKNGIPIQDVAIVGQQYHYNEDFGVVQDCGLTVKVFADENNESYTHQFHIGLREEEE